MTSEHVACLRSRAGERAAKRATTGVQMLPVLGRFPPSMHGQLFSFCKPEVLDECTKLGVFLARALTKAKDRVDDLAKQLADMKNERDVITKQLAETKHDQDKMRELFVNIQVERDDLETEVIALNAEIDFIDDESEDIAPSSSSPPPPYIDPDSFLAFTD
jgi:hypothetical protein